MTEASGASEELARFESGLDLVDAIARRIAREVGPSAELADLVSYGREGLLDAARKFDPNRGVPFRGYASFRVRGAIIDGVRQSARLPRRAHERLNGLAAANRVSEGASEDTFAPRPPGATAADAERALGEHLAAMATAVAVGLLTTTAYNDEGERVSVAADATPEEAFGRAEMLEVVRQAITELPAEEQTLVRRHYLEGERFDHVAAELGLSKSWASRLHTRAIKRLTEKLRGPAT
ncbi:MAG TPA: sigma-70 family RNA polymerase sigma factor [Polyangiaceae bacterium]|nr:sigma-70 family RNA polymerase sigma factor [Polyangiaceae bacterium]